MPASNQSFATRQGGKFGQPGGFVRSEPLNPKRPMRSLFLALVILIAAHGTTAFAAQDASIDRLLRKLPPPEKFVDPAQNDPLAKQMFAAAKARNFNAALEASRKLANKYPKSLGSHFVHGLLALALRRFPEAASSYRKAIALRPDFGQAYLGLGLAEASQGRYREALPNFQHCTRLTPKIDVGWMGASACAEKLGRRQESLDYARRGTVMAPSSAGAWFQLAREEDLFGSKQAAAKALARARKLQPKGSGQKLRSKN